MDFAAGRNRYTGYLISLALNSYKGIKVGLDCSNGSAWMLAKSVFDAFPNFHLFLLASFNTSVAAILILCIRFSFSSSEISAKWTLTVMFGYVNVLTSF